jgi:flagellar biosynthesis protein
MAEAGARQDHTPSRNAMVALHAQAASAKADPLAGAGRPGIPHTATAVALAYRDGQMAPQVVARGRGPIAEEILRRAGEAGIYVHQSRELVSLLMRVDIDDHIPPELYLVVAELLSWLYRTDRARQGTGP